MNTGGRTGSGRRRVGGFDGFSLVNGEENALLRCQEGTLGRVNVIGCPVVVSEGEVPWDVDGDDGDPELEPVFVAGAGLSGLPKNWV